MRIRGFKHDSFKNDAPGLHTKKKKIQIKKKREH